MWLILLLGLTNSLLVDIGRTCLCTELFYETDCTNYGCQFSSKLCLSLPCSEVESRVQCDSRMDCSFDHKSQTCQPFSQCNAFFADDPSQCNQKGNQLQGCISDGVKQTNGYYQCSNYMSPQISYVTCNTILEQAKCSGLQTDGKTCFWKDTSKECIGFELNSCSDASNLSNSLCATNFCTWKDSSCNEKQCSDLTSQSTCTNIPNLDGQKYIICNWNSVTSKCEILNSVSTLSADNCTTLTLGTYFWNDVTNKCIECVGNYQILLIIFNLWLIFLI